MTLFKCTPHKYGTDSIEEWRQHLEDEAHRYVGGGECNNCGKKFPYDITVKVKHTRIKPLVLCEDCKK